MEAEALALETVEVHDVNQIQRKMKFTGTVVKTTLAGAVVDIGIGIPGVVHISQIREEPVNRVEDVLHVGDTVDVWVRRIFPKKDRIELTMIKPLDLEWREIDNQSRGQLRDSHDSSDSLFHSSAFLRRRRNRESPAPRCSGGTAKYLALYSRPDTPLGDFCQTRG